MIRRLALLCVLIALVQPGVARADNTTSSAAHSIVIGGTPAEAAVNATGPVDRWYATRVFNGRSYCAETQGGVLFDTSAQSGNLDSVVTVYQGDATTVVVQNDDTISTTEPSGRFLSRACFRSTLTDGSLIFIKTSALSGAFNVRTRIVETTLYSNWFFIGADYSAFTLLRNTTFNPVTYTVEWRNSAGAIVGSTSGTLPGNGGGIVDARAFTATVSGTVQIAHNGSEDAIVVSATVLSGPTGLSFDAPFVSRRPW